MSYLWRSLRVVFVMSFLISLKFGFWYRWFMFSSSPVEKLSNAVTSALSSMNRSVTQLPRKPAAPVTKILLPSNSFSKNPVRISFKSSIVILSINVLRPFMWDD